MIILKLRNKTIRDIYEYYIGKYEILYSVGLNST